MDFTSTTTTTRNLLVKSDRFQHPRTFADIRDGGGGRMMSELIRAYIPAEWRKYACNVMESFRNFFIDEFTSKTIAWDNLTTAEWYMQMLLIGVVTSLILFLYSIIATIFLKLALPLFAQFLFIYWLLLWRIERTDHQQRPLATSPATTTTTTHNLPARLFNQWYLVAAITEISVQLIRYLINGDWFDHLVQCLVPLVALGATKVYFDRTDPSPSKAEHFRRTPIIRSTDDNNNGCAYGLACFAMTYAIRYFSVQGITLIPLALRPFMGYIAYYFAIRAAESVSKCKSNNNIVSCHCNGTLSASRDPSTTTNSLSAMPVKNNSAGKFHVLQEGDFLQLAGSANDRNSRRVSLPAGSLTPIMAQSNISEARGLIADMLAQKDLPPHLVSGLKTVSSLLLPATQSNNFLSHLDLPRITDAPCIIAPDGRVVGVETVGHRRQSPIVVTWSTTTSATGLPTLEPEPSRPRSSNYWKQKRTQERNQSPKIVTPQQSWELNSTLIQVSDGTLYSLPEIESDKYLGSIHEWSFPIFDIYADSPDTVLTRVAYTIFKRSDLFRIFKISKQKFFSFFHGLEEGYWKIPYHNRIHAADVMHATFYLVNNRVPAIANTGSPGRPQGENSTELTEDALEKALSGLSNGYCESPSAATDNDNTVANCAGTSSSPAGCENGKNGTLASVLSSLELLALYTAAAMHDYDHPGRTNAFLVAIEDKKAILYNDRSILENHHAAASWQLLCQKENNFVEHLDSAEFKRLRYMIIEAILATDLKRHFEILVDLNTKVNNCGLDWYNESDKLLTCQICIKMADINAPAKPFSLHKEWTNRIVDEFYAQGDDERQLGLPVSPYMDRDDPQLAALQDSFITHIVTPLVQGMNEAGLLPMVATDSSTMADSSYHSNGEPNSDSPSCSTSRAELLVHLERNHNYWKSHLSEQDAAKRQQQDLPGATKEENITNCGNGVVVSEMSPIEEELDENGSLHPDLSSRSCTRTD